MACKASTYPGALSKQEKCHQRDSWQMTEPQGETVEHFCDFRGAREVATQPVASPADALGPPSYSTI